MADDSFLNYIIDLLSPYGHIRSRAMFGGYGLYFNNVIFAIIISNELYFKSHPELAKYFAAQGSSPFTYEARGKSVTMSYWKVPIEVIEDEEALSIWFSKSILAAAHKK